ncbi:isovaleryl-CoA dehydrogenase (plasmid) [Azospirillum sp. B510]|uniref:acyl-CoA dehydrogenase family protein n=1 Tax=Azospirillum sp. (strain B510) TaxID=137722 RepID=UPI0001C4CB8D|nr:acyl-CoA dehydrogenase [Azospirillum sp. B510]BAI74830.1 isovaleryl-CoA dehydrogenase [Azospirillum sp. B510]
MNFDPTDEQRMLQDGAQRFIQEKYDLKARRALEKSEIGFDQSNWSLFAELGWLALPLPEDVGGIGGTFVDTTLLMTELGRGMVLEPYVSTAILAARIIDRSGATVHRDTLLPAIVKGRCRVTLAYLEPDGRYDPQQIKTTATATDDGYRLDGSKLMVLDAPSADHIIVTARLGGGICLFLVPSAMAGLDIRPYALVDGSRAADLRLKDIILPQDALLAGPETAMAILEDGLDRATLAQVAEALGVMETVMNLTADFLKTRRQFGQPIGKFQALQHRMAEMLIKAEDTRSMLYRALSVIDAPADTRQAAVSAAKVVAAEAGAFVSAEGIQLHGGIGVTDEYGVSHCFKKLLVLEKSYGAADWHLARYAAHL